MPRESYYTHHSEKQTLTDVISDDSHGTILELGWSKDGPYVMLGLSFPRVTEESPADQTRIHWMAFDHADRGTLNRLIRDLRRARDTAFGKDE